MPHTQLKLLTIALSLSSSLFIASASAAPIVQPGAPGDRGRILSAEEAVQITDTSYSPADVNFMQMMIPHHQQALEMADLVEGRTNRPELVEIAGRIKASQSDEIGFMEGWLNDRGESGMAHAHHMLSAHHKMEMGMATRGTNDVRNEPISRRITRLTSRMVSSSVMKISRRESRM